MLTVDKPSDMKAHVGEDIGASDWMTVDQAMIDKFADATGDHQWIHVDVERAKRDMPGGKTIAHGFLTLSLIAGLAHQTHEIRRRSRGINYGSDRVRFTSPVPVGVPGAAASEAAEGGGYRRRGADDVRQRDGDRGTDPARAGRRDHFVGV